MEPTASAPGEELSSFVAALLSQMVRPLGDRLLLA